MFENLPKNSDAALDWGVDDYAPYMDDLLQRVLSAETVDQWLADWTQVANILFEVGSRISVATTVDTTDEVAKKRYEKFHEEIMPAARLAGFQLNRKLVESGLQPDNFDVPLQKMQAEIALFREENLPLFTQESKLQLQYDEITGAHSVEWDGEEMTLYQLIPIAQDHDRAKREKAWRLQMARWLQDRDALNALWQQFMDVRKQIAANAGFDNFMDYQWQAMNRFDYTPQDSVTFHNAIEKVVVPASARLYEALRQQLGVKALRPWDIGGSPQGTGPDPRNRPPLRPYRTTKGFEDGLEAIFQRVDPDLGAYFQTMRAENLLDMDNRKNKAPGGYCTMFPQQKRPFIFANSVGVHDDVQTMLHEGGHAFHAFESFDLPYIQQQDVPMEFAEVASTAMELLSAPYLDDPAVGFYNAQQAARARVEHLAGIIRFLPYMAVVDAFQHWAYAHPEGSDPAACDAKWAELWDRFIPVVDYSSLEDIKATGWHRKLHIFQIPFYYVEYGLALVGALQVWANALEDQAQAVKAYRQALALGGTRSLPALFTAAGAKFAFDAGTLQGLVDLIETTLNDLEKVS